jgi:hypothetical protein
MGHFDCKIDFSEKEGKKTVAEDIVLPDTFIKLNYSLLPAKNVFYENAVNLAKEINIKKGERYFVNVTGKFIYGDFIGAFIQEKNFDVEILTVISLSASYDNIDMLCALVENGWVEKLDLYLSEYFLRTEMRKSTDTIRLLKKIAEENQDKIKISYSDLHSKITLIKTKCGHHFTIAGSANLRSSQSIEQFQIEENKELYDFNYNYYKKFMP